MDPLEIVAQSLTRHVAHGITQDARRKAIAALAALAAEGYAVVPVVPTLPMRRVAIEKKRRNRAFPETWKAVVAAAQESPT